MSYRTSTSCQRQVAPTRQPVGLSLRLPRGKGAVKTCRLSQPKRQVVSLQQVIAGGVLEATCRSRQQCLDAATIRVRDEQQLQVERQRRSERRQAVHSRTPRAAALEGADSAPILGRPVLFLGPAQAEGIPSGILACRSLLRARSMPCFLCTAALLRCAGFGRCLAAADEWRRARCRFVITPGFRLGRCGARGHEAKRLRGGAWATRSGEVRERAAAAGERRW